MTVWYVQRPPDAKGGSGKPDLKQGARKPIHLQMGRTTIRYRARTFFY